MTSPPKTLYLWLLLSLTLGLAPFKPEPHVWEKIKWVMSGATGMRPIDWFDLVLHGTPWIMLIATLFMWLSASKKDES